MKPLSRIGLTFAAGLPILTFLASPAWAAEHIVGQKNKEFSTKAIAIKVGDTVEFRNDDTVSHNVFSLSDIKAFDLGSYTQGQSRKVVFDKAGKVEVECSIHPNMRVVIDVKP